MVFAIVDDSGRMKRLFKKVAEIFMEVIARHYKEVKSFKGGYSFGFYPVWSPEKCIWFQEDLSAILSPDHFSEFLKEPAEMICKDYDYTAVHLHPASFFIVDELLKIDRLKAIEVNKDIGGPTVAEMIPIFRRILEKKNLIVWGDLDEADIDVIAGALPPRGIYLNPVVPDADRANALMNHMLNVA